MDTTPENILMCEKAVEIQKAWKPKCGDFVGESADNSSMTISYTDLVDEMCTEVDIKKVRSNWIWLLRQDQLQEMILKDWIGKKPCCLLLKFYNWVNLAEKENSWIDDYTSMEQLWLAFIMKEKYNKVWNGKDWVNK